MKIYFVAGEASGDIHGAALMRSLRALHAEIKFIGRGGPRMREIAGESFRDWSEHSAVLGLWEVLRHYRYFRQEFRAAIEEIRAAKPDAVVLIDYPGFNLRLARALRTKLGGSGGKIIYYISPQVWAWNRARIPKMARWLDLMLCIFPFEAELYNQSGLRAVFVGHPMMEGLRAKRISAARDANLIGLFPGSRRREVRKILPVMLEAARMIRAQKPETIFEIAAANNMLASEIKSQLQGAACFQAAETHGQRFGVLENAAPCLTSDAASLMQRAVVAMIASGTATLEAAYFRLPFVLVYRVAWLTYLAARLVVKVKHLGMPNVLANREIVPELIQGQAKAAAICQAVLQLMNDKVRREQMIADFDSVIAKLGEGKASEAAARIILDELN